MHFVWWYPTFSVTSLEVLATGFLAWHQTKPPSIICSLLFSISEVTSLGHPSRLVVLAISWFPLAYSINTKLIPTCKQQPCGNVCWDKLASLWHYAFNVVIVLAMSTILYHLSKGCIKSLHYILVSLSYQHRLFR